MKSNKTMKANDIINNRKMLDKQIANNWQKIRLENVHTKDFKPTIDLKLLYEDTRNLVMERVFNKLDSVAINMGIKSRADFPINSLYPTIYRLSELRELDVILRKLPTVHPKVNKASTNKLCSLSYGFIQQERKRIQKDITILLDELTKYNTEFTFDTSGAYKFLVC